MNRIEVDFNNRGAGGTVRGSLRRAGDVKLNEAVVIVDSDEGMEFEARVVEIDLETGRVLYAPLWERVGFEEALRAATKNVFWPRAASVTLGAGTRMVYKSDPPAAFVADPFAHLHAAV